MWFEIRRLVISPADYIIPFRGYHPSREYPSLRKVILTTDSTFYLITDDRSREASRIIVRMKKII